jgi:hypothetical protein
MGPLLSLLVLHVGSCGRPANDLLVAGVSCDGGEAAEAQGGSFRCERGQWLVTIDAENYCTPEGCTAVEVRPFIAYLARTAIEGPSELFTVEPEIPVTPETGDVLERVYVRNDAAGGAAVIFR